MKIGIIADSLDTQYAGIHYFTKNLVESLNKKQHTDEYVIFRCKSGKLVNKKCKEVVIPNYRWIPGYMFIRLFILIPYYVRKLDLDVLVETAHFGPFNLPKNIKRVTVLHDLTPLIKRKWHTLSSFLLHKIFLKGIVKRADMIITNSAFTARDVELYFKKDKELIHPMHLGVSPEFKMSSNKKVLGKLGIYKPFFLYLGTIEPRKNIHRLIMAFEKFKEQNPDAKEQLILAGKIGWKSGRVLKARENSSCSDDIIILGYVDRQELPVLLSSCAIFLYPSLYEGFGLPVLEALACGARVLTSNNTCLPEIAGPHATYFDPYDEDDIADKLTEVYKTPDTQAQARSDYGRSFTWAKTSREFVKALNSLFEGSELNHI